VLGVSGGKSMLGRVEHENQYSTRNIGLILTVHQFHQGNGIRSADDIPSKGFSKAKKMETGKMPVLRDTVSPIVGFWWILRALKQL